MAANKSNAIANRRNPAMLAATRFFLGKARAGANGAAFILAAVPWRMAESAALLVEEVFPEQLVRHWVLSVPYPLREGAGEQ
jgi:hypothetical protein